MINNHVEYLRKFGSIRIQNYSDFLLKTCDFNTTQKAYIRQLPEYYKEDCIRMEGFIKMMSELNLWYTLYL